MSLKFAIIGLGQMGKNHLRVLQKMDGCEVVATCDVAGPADGNTSFNNIEDLLKACKPDAAIIATPTNSHFEVAKRLLKKKIPLLIEKPVASNPKQGRELAALAAEAGVPVAVGHVERFNPVVQALKKELLAKDIFSIAITRVGPIPPRVTDVGILMDLAVHDVDLVQEVSGRKVMEASIFRSRKIHSEHEDNAVLSFALEAEIVASVTTNWLTPFKKRSIEVATRDAYFMADLIAQDLTEYSSFAFDTNTYLVRKCRVATGEPLKNELEAFVKLVTHGDDMHGLATIEDSVRTLEIVSSRTI